MGRSFGRATAPAASALLNLAATVLLPTTAFAQGDEEVIVDPELQGSPAATEASGGEDEVIVDPEAGSAPQEGPRQDYGWGPVLDKEGITPKATAAASEEEDAYDPLANTGIGKLEIQGQTAIDLHREDNLEDFYEARLRFGGEVDFRISRKLRLALGTRIDFQWAAPNQNDPDLKRDQQGALRPSRYTALEQDRYEVDIIPLAAYADLTVAEGVHLRIGEQVVSMGRMDGYSATDILAVYDLRAQARPDLAALKLAQPAIRVDWDINSWATLQAVYVPWFMPHLSRPNRDRYVSTVTAGSGAQVILPDSSTLIAPSNQTRATESALRLVGPPPDFKSPQAEARLNFRGNSFELALVAGTALEKIPAVYYVPAIDQFLRGPDTVATDAAAQQQQRDQQQTDLINIASLAARAPVLDVEYHRYYLLGFDGSFDISPLLLGFEFGFSPERHFYASTTDGSSLPLPNVSEQICNPPNADTGVNNCLSPSASNGRNNVIDKSIRKGVPVVQGTLHVEWIKGEDFVIAAEAFLIQALALPYDKTRDWAGFIPKTGAFVGGLVGATYLLEEGKYRFDLSAVATAGPSLIVSPLAEMRVLDSFYVNLGLQLFEGPAPKLAAGLAARDLTLGGIFSGYDNVFLGFRYVP